jgi:hypothetical protein
MNWEEATQDYVTYEAYVLSDTKKTALEKAQDRGRTIRDLLSQMPNLANKTIENITPQIWMDSLTTFKKGNRDYKRMGWGDLIGWEKYEFLRNCFVYARDDYTCHYCDAKDSDIDVHFSVDHLTPKSKDGEEDLDNLVCCCKQDNRAKLNNPELFKRWMKNKTLKISPEVHARLLEFGRKSETIGQIIERHLADLMRQMYYLLKSH